MGQAHEIFMSEVLQREEIMGFQRNITTVASLVYQILRNQNQADISVMAVSRKQVAHLFGINVV